MDRPQQNLGVVLLPFHSFVPVSELPNGHHATAAPLDPCTEATEEYSASPYRVIFSVQSESWITVTNLLRFLPADDPDIVRFIWASEETGFMHLYLVEALKKSNADEEAAEADSSGETVQLYYPRRASKKFPCFSLRFGAAAHREEGCIN